MKKIYLCICWAIGLAVISGSCWSPPPPPPPPTPPTVEVKTMPSSYLTEDDVDYFASSVVDYLNDFGDFSQALDSLSNEEIQRLYIAVEDRVYKVLGPHLGREFSGDEERDKWIVKQIDEIRREVVEDATGFLARSRP